MPDAALSGHGREPGQHTVGVVGPPRDGIPIVAAEELGTTRPLLVQEVVPLLIPTGPGGVS